MQLRAGKCVHLVSVIVAVTSLGCAKPVVPPATVAFDSLFTNTFEHALVQTPSDSLAGPAGLLARRLTIVVADAKRGEVKEYDRGTGALIRIIGGPGDGAGDFRSPIGIAPMDSERFVVLDSKRRVLSVRDSSGKLVRETHVAGYWNGIDVVDVIDGQRIVLAGRTDQGGPESARRTQLHEFDVAGNLANSYRAVLETSRLWEATFSTVFLTHMGNSVISGSYNSNSIEIFDRASGKEHKFAVAAGWYQPLDWPSNSTSSGSNGANAVDAWARKQRLMSAVFALSPPRFLVRFDAYSPSGEKVYYYAIADTSGRTLGVTPATPAKIMATKGDTAFWIIHSHGAATFGSGIAGGTRPAAATTSSY